MRNRNYPRRFVRRNAPNNAVDEGHQQAGMGGLPEDLMMERELRPPILTPRGNPSDNPFGQMPVPAQQPSPVRSYNPQTMNTYRVDVPAGVPTPIFAATRERSYSLIVNGGANDAVITYSRAPASAGDGIPLAAAGVGFHELINGTTSTMTAFSTLGTFLICTEGRYDPAMEL